MSTLSKPLTLFTLNWGRLSAGLVGGLVLALAVGVTCSVYWPSEAFDRMFMGALLFPGVWVTAMTAAFTANGGKQAWTWVGIPSLLFVSSAGVGLWLNLGA